jgi:nicotinamidase-related amidase
MDQRVEHERVLSLIAAKNGTLRPLREGPVGLVLVDMQSYFTRPGYPFSQALETLSPGVTEGYFERVERGVIPSCRRLLEAFRAAGQPIVYTAIGTTADGGDLSLWLKDFDAMGRATTQQRIWPAVGDEIWQIDPEVAPADGEPVFNKTSSGALASSPVDLHLHNLGVRSVAVAGLTTEVCVTTTARELSDRGFDVIVVEDGCTCMSPEMHRSALDSFNLVFGRLLTTDVLCAEVARRAASEGVTSSTS